MKDRKAVVSSAGASSWHKSHRCILVIMACLLVMASHGVLEAKALPQADEARYIHQLQTGTIPQREAAAQQLGQAPSEAGIEALVAAMEDVLARDAAFAALGGIGEPAAEALLEATASTNAMVRMAVVQVLGQIKSRKALPRLEELLQDKEPLVRQAAHVAIGRIEGRSGSATLARMLDEDRDYFVKHRAATGLIYVGDREAIPALLKALKHPYHMVIKPAAVALGRIGDPSTIEPLRDLLIADKTYHRVRECVAEAIAKIGGDEALKVLVSALDAKLKTEIRINSAYALGLLGNPAAISPLKDLLKEEDYDLRVTALKSLGRIDDPQAIMALQWARDHGNADMASMVDVAIRNAKASADAAHQ